MREHGYVGALSHGTHGIPRGVTDNVYKLNGGGDETLGRRQRASPGCHGN